jgi:Zn-dependent peptidase ImmA (M78 family)
MSTLSTARKQDIQETVNFVVEEYQIEYPLNFEKILTDIGLNISYGNYENAFDGLLEYKEKKFHIFCNLDRLKERNNPRTRFTIAHELGHYFIDEHYQALVTGKMIDHCSFTEDYSSNFIIEQEADHFASCLLLPENEILKLLKKRKKGILSILEISTRYKASITSAAIKYVNLDIVPCAIIMWGTDKKYKWKFLSDNLRRLNYKKTIEEFTSKLRDSATETIFKTANQEQMEEKVTTAATWFPFVKAGSHNDSLMNEQAISLGQYGVLTLLYPLEQEKESSFF